MFAAFGTEKTRSIGIDHERLFAGCCCISGGDETHTPVLQANVDAALATGNVQGGRFVEDYPFTLSGASHAAALTYGYLTGKYLAEQA